MGFMEFCFLKAAWACEEAAEREEQEAFYPFIEDTINYIAELKEEPSTNRFQRYEALYKILSATAQSEGLREHFLDQIKKVDQEGSKFSEQLAFIPNRFGNRFTTKSEEAKLREQILAITQTNPETSVEVAASFFEDDNCHYLKPEFITQLGLDGEGNIKRQYADSLHRVCRIQSNNPDHSIDLHLKQKPSHPMQEYAIYNLTSRISGKGAAPSQLVRFNIRLSNGKQRSHPILISQTVVGRTLKEILETEPESDFHPEQLTHLMLLGLLTRPGDARAANFIVNEKNHEVICIDNDVSFVEPITKDKMGFTNINFCSILYCLDPTPGLHPKVIAEWSRLSPDLIISDWLKDLMKREQEYLTLFDETERRALYEEDPNLQFTPQLVLRSGVITTLYAQFKNLQNLNKKNPTPTNGLELLNHLITLGQNGGVSDVGPRIFKAYKTAAATSASTTARVSKSKNSTFMSSSVSLQSNPSERLRMATDRKQEKSITTPQAFKASVGKVPTCKEIESRELFSLDKVVSEFMAFSILSESDNGITLARQGKEESLSANFSAITLKSQQTTANEEPLKPDPERQNLIFSGLLLLMSQSVEMGSLPSSIALTYCAVLDSEGVKAFLHPNLTYLDLRHSGSLEKIPVEIEQCVSLKELYLSGCQNLQRLSRSTLLSQDPLLLPKLEILHIARCPELKSIQIDAPKISKFKASDNPKLKDLIVRAHWLDFDLKNSPQVDLDKAFQGSFPIGAQLLKHNFTQLQQLTTLDLSYNDIGAEGVKALAVALPQLQQLTTLNLYYNNISDEGAKALAVALPQLQQLTTLNLYYNNIGAEGVKALTKALPQLQQLTTLNLCYNSVGDEGAKALTKALPQLQQLTTLSIRDNNISADGVKALVVALPQLQQLTTLHLGGNNIGDEGVKALAENALSQLQRLTTLDLNNNNIGAEGAKALTLVLPQLQQLTTLHLNNNNIGDEGVKALAENALPQLQQLTTLHLNNNNIGAEGAKALAWSLFQLQQLTTLHLNNNNIGADGAKALAPSLLQLQQLTTLDLNNNNIGAESKNILNQAKLPKLSIRYSVRENK